VERCRRKIRGQLFLQSGNKRKKNKVGFQWRVLPSRLGREENIQLGEKGRGKEKINAVSNDVGLEVESDLDKRWTVQGILFHSI